MLIFAKESMTEFVKMAEALKIKRLEGGDIEKFIYIFVTKTRTAENKPIKV